MANDYGIEIECKRWLDIKKEISESVLTLADKVTSRNWQVRVVQERLWRDLYEIHTSIMAKASTQLKDKHAVALEQGNCMLDAIRLEIIQKYRDLFDEVTLKPVQLAIADQATASLLCQEIPGNTITSPAAQQISKLMDNIEHWQKGSLPGITSSTDPVMKTLQDLQAEQINFCRNFSSAYDSIVLGKPVNSEDIKTFSASLGGYWAGSNIKSVKAATSWFAAAMKDMMTETFDTEWPSLASFAACAMKLKDLINSEQTEETKDDLLAFKDFKADSWGLAAPFNAIADSSMAAITHRQILTKVMEPFKVSGQTFEVVPYDLFAATPLIRVSAQKCIQTVSEGDIQILADTSIPDLIISFHALKNVVTTMDAMDKDTDTITKFVLESASDIWQNKSKEVVDFVICACQTPTESLIEVMKSNGTGDTFDTSAFDTLLKTPDANGQKLLDVCKTPAAKAMYISHKSLKQNLETTEAPAFKVIQQSIVDEAYKTTFDNQLGEWVRVSTTISKYVNAMTTLQAMFKQLKFGESRLSLLKRCLAFMEDRPLVCLF